MTPRKPKLLAFRARPEWLAALDRLVAASGADGRAVAVERAVEALAERHGLVMPPRCRPLGWNQHDARRPEDDSE